MVQWLRINLAMQGMPVQSLVQEGPMCGQAAEPVSHSYSTHMLQLRKPVSLESLLPSKRRHCKWEACAWKLESSPHSLQLEKTHMQQQRPSVATKRIFKKYKREERIATGHSLYMHVLYKPCKNAMGLALLSLFHMLETETDWVSCYSGVEVGLQFHCIIQSPKIKNSLGNFHSTPPPMF